MRLIDADELKYKNLAEVNGKLTYVLTAEEIDNAPTVEQKYYERVIAQINPVIEARPQGEWIFNTTHWSCSACNETVKTIGYCGTEDFMSANFKFCPNCGAEMKRKPRDCEHCKHYVERDGSQGCESWDCHFEEREDG